MKPKFKKFLIIVVFIFFIALVIDLSFIALTTIKKYNIYNIPQEVESFESSAFIPQEIKEIDLNLTSNMSEMIYIAPYVGDIDGEVSDDWLYFFGKLADFHNDNEIPSAFSFYPGTMRDDEAFKSVFLKMYSSRQIELVQKGYIGDKREMIMNQLSSKEQRDIVKKGQEEFRAKMQNMTGSNNIKMPLAYNQREGNLDENSIKILESLGFNFYFDMFVGGLTNPMNSTKTFDNIQYGVGFTREGVAGKESIFYKPEEIFNQIKSFQVNQPILTINGVKVIPLWVHQQDFESKTMDNEIDQEKWNIYINVLKALQKDPNVILISPSRIYAARH